MLAVTIAIEILAI